MAVLTCEARGAGGVVIGQAKRYASWSNLKPAVRQERAKLDQLNPARYLLLTSCSLSPGNKDELLALLAPYCQSPADIYGRDDLDAALARQPQVLQRHFKLWLQDAEQIRAVLHSGLLQLSGAQLESIIDALRHFVVHPFVERALEHLDQQNICLITGDPGVGKTTLCGYLALQLAARDGYEVHILRDTTGIEGAWELLQPGRKQCLVLDDFLGATFLDTQAALTLEHSLIALLNKAKKSQGQLKLLIASRGYVLKQAVERLPKLARWLSDEVEGRRLDYSRLSLRTKADILFNQIHFSGLADAQKQHLVNTKSYWRIIRHPHFNPRLLENILRDGRHSKPDQLADWLIQQLDDPTQYWEKTFERLSPEAQCLLYTLALGSGELEEADLSYTYAPLYQALQGRMPGPGSLQAAMSELEPDLVTSAMRDNHVWLRYSNPSIADLSHRMLAQHPGMIEAAITSMRLYQQGSRLLALHNASESGIRLRPAQLEQLLTNMERLLGESKKEFINESLSWRAEEGYNLGDYWQSLHATPEATTLSLYPQLKEKLARRASNGDWQGWLRQGRFSSLLDLACNLLTAECAGQVIDTALGAIQNSNDAVGLVNACSADLKLKARLTAQCRELMERIEDACINEVERAQDDDHIAAVLEDIETIKAMLGVDLYDAKHAAWQAMERVRFGGDDKFADDVPVRGTQRMLDIQADTQYVDSMFNELI